MVEKFKLSSIEVLIPKVLIDSNISHDEFPLTKNVLKEYHNIKNKTNSKWRIKELSDSLKV